MHCQWTMPCQWTMHCQWAMHCQWTTPCTAYLLLLVLFVTACVIICASGVF